MKKIFLLIGLLFSISLLTQAQTDSQKEGGYFNFNSFRSNSPEMVSSFDVVKRSDFDIKMVAGNGYKVTSADNEANAKIKRDIWGIYMNDTLFINGKLVNGRSHYCKVENKGIYLYLTGEIPTAAFSQKYGFKRSMLEGYPSSSIYPSGAIGGAISGAQLAMLKVYYFLNTNSGEILLLTRDNLLKVLPPDSILIEQIKKCEPNYNPDLLVKYLNNLIQ